MPRRITETAGASMSLIPLDSSESAASIARQIAPWNPTELRITSVEIVTALVAYPNTMIFRQFLLSWFANHRKHRKAMVVMMIMELAARIRRACIPIRCLPVVGSNPGLSRSRSDWPSSGSPGSCVETDICYSNEQPLLAPANLAGLDGL